MATKHLTIEEVVNGLHAAGFNRWQLVTMGAIIQAESSRNVYAINVNAKPGMPDHLSLDVGLGQVNTYWHPEKTIKELLDPIINLKECNRIFYDFIKKTGSYSGGYTAWNTYKNGFYERYLSDYHQAARDLGYL